MNIKIKDKSYEVVKDYGETVKEINFDEIVTDYYDNFDYIVGDWAYGKIRLKGFCKKKNKNFKRHNNIKNVEDYLKNNCAYGCKHFILKKLKND